MLVNDFCYIAFFSNPINNCIRAKSNVEEGISQISLFGSVHYLLPLRMLLEFFKLFRYTELANFDNKPSMNECPLKVCDCLCSF